MAWIGRISNPNGYVKNDIESMEYHILTLEADYLRLRNRYDSMMRTDKKLMASLTDDLIKIPGCIRRLAGCSL